MKNTLKLFGAMRSIAIIAMVAGIGLSMAGCDDDPGSRGDFDQTIFFPEALAGEFNCGGVRWDMDGKSVGESVYVHFKNDTLLGQYRASFSFSFIGGGSYSLNAKNGDTYTIWRYLGWNAEEEEYAIFSFTAIVEANGKLTISDATLINDEKYGHLSIAQAVPNLNGTYTKAAN